MQRWGLDLGLEPRVSPCLRTDPGDSSLQVVLAQVGSLVADGLFRFLHRAAHLTAAAVERLQKLQQDAALLLTARGREGGRERTLRGLSASS